MCWVFYLRIPAFHKHTEYEKAQDHEYNGKSDIKHFVWKFRTFIYWVFQNDILVIYYKSIDAITTALFLRMSKAKQ